MIDEKNNAIIRCYKSEGKYYVELEDGSILTSQDAINWKLKRSLN